MQHQNDTDRQKPKYWEKHLCHCHFSKHKCHIYWPVIETQSLQSKASLSHDTVPPKMWQSEKEVAD
jgi:hypothetical protein